MKRKVTKISLSLSQEKKRKKEKPSHKMQRDDDPFASLQQLCRISSSQEQQLSHCEFAGQLEYEFFSGDDPGGIPVASTGIVMLSLPDSPDEKEFHTPHSLAVSQEQQQKNVAFDQPAEVATVAESGNSAAVDLGKDADQGFSAEVEVTERIKINSASKASPGVNQLNENKVIHSESINFRIGEGQVIASDGFRQTSAKKLKIVDTPEPRLGLEASKTLERVAKSMEKLKSPSKSLDGNMVLESSRITPATNKTRNFSRAAKKLSFEGASPRNCLNSLQNHQNENLNGVDKEFHEGRSAKRRILSVSAVNEGETTGIEEISRLCNTNETSSSGANSNGRLKDRVMKCVDGINKLRNVGPTGEKSSGERKDCGIKRALPVSLLGNNSNNAQGEVVSKVITVFDVLRELAKEYSFDPSLAKMSALETAKRAGMTFP